MAKLYFVNGRIYYDDNYKTAFVNDRIVKGAGWIAPESGNLHYNPKSELLREPNLLVPDNKPIGKVKIDYSHPLTKNLQCCFVHTQQQGFVELVQNLQLITNDSAVIRNGRVNPGGGRPIRGALFPTGTNGYLSYAAPPEMKYQSKISVYYGFRGTSSSNNTDGFALCKWGDRYHITGIRIDNLNVDFQIDKVDRARHVTAAGKASAGTYLKLGMTWDGTQADADKVVGYSSANYGAIQKHTGSALFGTATVFGDRLIIGGTGSYSTIDNSGVSDRMAIAGMMWNRKLSEEEMSSIINDPYQFLIPA